jgi:hypothetical protein
VIPPSAQDFLRGGPGVAIGAPPGNRQGGRLHGQQAFTEVAARGALTAPELLPDPQESRWPWHRIQAPQDGPAIGDDAQFATAPPK